MGKDTTLLKQAPKSVQRSAWFTNCIAGVQQLLAPQPPRRKLRRVALVDIGSLKPAATLSLRRLAAALETLAEENGWTDFKVDAVSMKFANRIAAEKLEDKPAELLPAWLQRVANEGPSSSVLLLPLFIGPSSTIGSTMVEAVNEVSALEVEIAPPLVCGCPFLFPTAPAGAGELASILKDRLAGLPTCNASDREDVVLLCDHGSPAAAVARAREAVRIELETLLGKPVSGCCMERREGPEYDFNGPLLEKALRSMPEKARVRVALLFLQQGKHAGPGGDIAGIVAEAQKERPDLIIHTTEVLAGHPGLLSLLLARAGQGVPVRLFGAHAQ